ncbi:MAG: 16S rRNA (guanine(527)-N(7))-methyltransferase RsmG [Rickettsiaceae bacterium]|nr:16S rRNA (guanine(527)-N(7))-methyltransferase RsmG [Rickettsiaceae bacterium]
MQYQEFLTFFPNVPRGAFLKIQEYLQILLKWNERTNLISKNEIPNIWERHIINCAQLCDFIKKDQKILDVGSGNGLPGIILAILTNNNVVLVENQKRRVDFLQHVIDELHLDKVSIVYKDVRKLNLQTDILVARAFKSLENLFAYCQKIIVSDKMLLLKGNKLDEEIVYSKNNWNFNYIKHASKFSDNSYIVEIFEIAKMLN